MSATNGDNKPDLDVLVTPVHKTLFAEDRCVDRDLLWSSFSKWQCLASDCSQLPRCVSGIFSMLATVLAHECCTPLVYSSSLRFRGKSDTSSAFRDITQSTKKKSTRQLLRHSSFCGTGKRCRQPSAKRHLNSKICSWIQIESIDVTPPTHPHTHTHTHTPPPPPPPPSREDGAVR